MRTMFETTRSWRSLKILLYSCVACVPFWLNASEIRASPAPLPEPAAIDPQIVQAWQQAGAAARSGWRLIMPGEDPREPADSPKLPIFLLGSGLGPESGQELPRVFKPKSLANLPAPSVPFALLITFDDFSATDINLWKELARFKTLQQLDIMGLQLTDKRLEGLAGLQNLRVLRLCSTSVTGASLKEIAGLKNLQSLTLVGMSETGANLKELAGLKNLQSLNLLGSDVTDAGLKGLAGNTNLKNLQLWLTKVTDTGMKELAGLKNLHTLSLHQTQVGDAGLKELTGLKDLVELDLCWTQVTDAGLKELTGLNNLRELTLTATRVTYGGMEELKKSLPNCNASNPLAPLPPEILRELNGTPPSN